MLAFPYAQFSATARVSPVLARHGLVDYQSCRRSVAYDSYECSHNRARAFLQVRKYVFVFFGEFFGIKLARK